MLYDVANGVSYAAIVIISCLQVALSNNCNVVGPNVFRIGTKETIAIFVEGVPQQVRVMLETYPDKRQKLFDKSVLVNAGDAPHIMEVAITAAKHTELQLDQKSEHLTLTVKCGSVWERETQVLLSTETGGHVFLQTDKPIYHPGATVNIRLLAVDEKLVPSDGNITMEVRNPQGVIVEQRGFYPRQQLMLTHTVNLPGHTLSGEWSVTAKYGYKLQQNTTVTFSVEKYVLPRFAVELKTVDYILTNFTSVRCLVRATFLNKLPVQGVVTFKFSVKTELVEYHIGKSDRPKQLHAGRADYFLKREDVEAKLGKKFQNLFEGRSRLVVEATVTEEATSAKESARNEKAFFSTTPFIISTDKSQRSFKPGIKTYIVAQLTYLNGDPAKGVKMQLIAKDRMVSKTDEKGIATFPIQTSLDDNTLNVQVSTIDPRLDSNQQAHSFFALEKYSKYEAGFIAIERADPKKTVKLGEIYEATIFAFPTEKFKSAYYVVLSKGRVLRMNKLVEGKVLQRSISFKVTSEMTPSFRLVVFADADGEIVSDSILVNAEPSCAEASQFSVRLEKTEEQGRLEPGEQENLIIIGTPGTRVGLLGVDRAVYLLRQKDLLTREKLFQNLDSKDLGCGAGGGTTSANTLHDSGIVVLTGQNNVNLKREDLSCQKLQRRKREAPQDIVEQYADGELRNCCRHGLRQDTFLRSCSERTEALKLSLDEEEPELSDACVEAFEECCYHAEEQESNARAFGEGRGVLVEDVAKFEGIVRSDFRETWIFKDVTIGDDGRHIFRATLPHSITTWDISAVSVAPTGGICVMEPLEIVTFKKLFVEVNVPYSVKKNEQIEIPATVYNYGNKNTKVKVALLGTKDICSGAREGEISAVKTLDVEKGHGVTAIFPVIPLAVGLRNIEARVVSNSEGSDSVRVPLRIEPSGVQKSKTLNIVVDPKNQNKRKQRSITYEGYKEEYGMGENKDKQIIQIRHPRVRNAVPGSERCELGIVGNPMGPALQTVVKNPEKLMIMPTGCGEQTMIGLAPTLYAYGYLKTAGLIGGRDEDTALDFIRSGYKRMLTFRKENGSFSVWTSHPSSLWLTSFVIRNLCEARKSTNIDEAVISSGLQYIITQQTPDGSFQDKYHLHHRDLLGGVNGPVPLSAYVLLTLQECANDGIQVENLELSRARAAAFLENNIQATTPAYTLALAGYALSLQDSGNKSVALEWLEAAIRHDKVRNTRHVPSDNAQLTIQATSYALMAFLNEKRHIDYISSFVLWLNEQMQPSGSLSSTQDTVVALQALAKYATFSKDNHIDLACSVTLSNNKDFSQNIRIRRDNAYVLNRIEIPNAAEQIFVSVKGTGTAQMYLEYKYHEALNRTDICKFNITVNFEERRQNPDVIFGRVQRSVRKQPRRKQRERIYRMKACARSLTGKDTAMAILDVGLLTGFKPTLVDLEKVVTDGIADYYEETGRNVAFYVPSIRADSDTCVEFRLERKFVVGKIQSSYVKAYDYYHPDVSCTEFYNPGNRSPLLKLHCVDSDVCTCAEGGCPNSDPLPGFIKQGDEQLPAREQQENIRQFACDEVDYAWLGLAGKSFEQDGFIYAEFEIKTVLKPGREEDEFADNNVRVVKARDRCTSFNMTEGTEYIIMGKDSEYNENAELGPPQPVYLIDTAAIVIPKKQSGVKQKLVNWFIDEFQDEDRRCFS